MARRYMRKLNRRLPRRFSRYRYKNRSSKRYSVGPRSFLGPVARRKLECYIPVYIYTDGTVMVYSFSISGAVGFSNIRSRILESPEFNAMERLYGYGKFYGCKITFLSNLTGGFIPATSTLTILTLPQISFDVIGYDGAEDNIPLQAIYSDTAMLCQTSNTNAYGRSKYYKFPLSMSGFEGYPIGGQTWISTENYRNNTGYSSYVLLGSTSQFATNGTLAPLGFAIGTLKVTAYWQFGKPKSGLPRVE